MKTCAKCNGGFEITDWDNAFYEKIQVPEPKFCHQCRNQRRMSFRNERHLYQRKCDLCSKAFLSNYYGEKPFPVYCYDCWWSDKWDSLDYGLDYDSGRPFFEQFGELMSKVPHLGVVSAHCENSDYVNYTNYSRNCYLIFGCHADEDCYYGWRVHSSLQCIDCLQIDKSQYCYDCVDCDECYALFFSQDCGHCSDSAFLYDCKSCQDCLFSAGLRNKKYCIFNKQYSKEEYEVEKKKFDFSSNEGLLSAKGKFQEFLKDYPRRSRFIINSENVNGDHIVDSKNVEFSFNVKNVHDGAYLESCEDVKDVMDCTFSGWPGELVYECISAGITVYNEKFSASSWSCTNIDYCDSCHHSKELFGCFGLRKKNEYCILNKQYGEAEYAELKAKIIKNMTARGEYGEFFPSELSDFGYNETVANDYYPLSKEAAIAGGFTWKEPNPRDYRPASGDILACEDCGKNYKAVAQELEFYKKFKLPVPRKCFDCRHQGRMAQRNPRCLWDRECSKCGAGMQTPFSPERPEKVYCEKCYLEGVY
jgi:CxxC-x17-CxxC domain-containing protein